MKDKIVKLVMLLSLVFIVGTLGACDNNTISFKQAVIQAIIGVAIAVTAYYIHRRLQDDDEM